MTSITLICLVTLMFGQLWVTSNGQSCLSPKPAHVYLNKIRGKFYFVDVWAKNTNSTNNCITVTFLRRHRNQPRLQNITYMTKSGEIRTDQYILRQTGIGQYTRQNATNPAQTIPIIIMYYNRVDLLVYACLESQNVNLYLLMSKNHNMPQADKDAVYKYSEPIAPGYFLNKATYNGCNIDDL